MALLTVQRPTTAGVAITLAAAAVGGDSFPNNGQTFFRIKNAGAGAVTVTFDSPTTCSFGVAANAAHDLAVVVTNDSAVYEIGPFTQGRYNDDNSRVQVTYTGVTSVTVAAVGGA